MQGSPMTRIQLFATCPLGMETALAEELAGIGGSEPRTCRAGVEFQGSLATAYRVCLWSRLASRVLLPLKRFLAPTPEALYEGVKAIDWTEHLTAENTFAVDCNTRRSEINHSRYAALKVKDAVVDQFRERTESRPSVDRIEPDLRLNLHLWGDHAVLSLDLSGSSLHRRGYRGPSGKAPLKETLAAAVLLKARWPATSERCGAFVDLMCGSGTLLIEAALMAFDVAPGLLRSHYGFTAWRKHDAEAWSALLAEARARRDAGLARSISIRGYDGDGRAVEASRQNVLRAGLSEKISVEVRELGDCVPEDASMGLVAVNPPYGERLKVSELDELYAQLQDRLIHCFPGWQAAVLAGGASGKSRMSLRLRRHYFLYNGPIPCTLFVYDLKSRPKGNGVVEHHKQMTAPADKAEMLVRRIYKNRKRLEPWAGRHQIGCYRVYDADLPEFNLAIDIYQGEDRFVHVQEYEAPATIDPKRASERRQAALSAIPGALDISSDKLFFKVRRKQRGSEQYEKLSDENELHVVYEGDHRFWVNLSDYLDTGLFLDHRLTRALLAGIAHGKRFCNLFGYTGTATVYAASAGAAESVTVDMSRTYLSWAKRNMSLNGLQELGHSFVQSDVISWLQKNRDERFGLVFLDPPTFSRSKRMMKPLDLQRDHSLLIRQTVDLLEPSGILVFSTNFRRFRMDDSLLHELSVEEITHKTIPLDFARNPHIHRCFMIRPGKR